MTKKILYQIARTTKAMLIVCLLIVCLLICALPQIADAQLIAYEGFDYPNGDLATVATGTLGGGTGWEPGVGWVDRDRDGSGGPDPFDSFITTNLPDGWGYTDSQGNQLQSSGSALLKTKSSEEKRNFDLSGIDPALLRTSDQNPVVQPDAFGAGGAELWISFLGEGRDPPDGIGNQASLLFTDGFGGDQLKKFRIGRLWKRQQDGSSGGENDSNDSWGISAPGSPLSPGFDIPGLGVTGDSAFDKVFFVARIQYFDSGQAIPGDASNIFGDEIATVWVNPILGNTAPSEESAVISNLIVADHAIMGLWTEGEADTYFDEIRVGTAYADVAPIAAGQAGDFDDDLDVDGADFLEWQRDLGDSTSLTAWEENYGTVPAVSAASAVPEPSSLLLVFIMAILVMVSRSHGRVSLAPMK